MRKSSNNRHKNVKGGGSYAALAILFVILLAVGGYYFYGRSSKVTHPSPPSAEPRIDKSIAPPLPPVNPPIVVDVTKPAPAEYPVEPVKPQEKVSSITDKAVGSGRLAIIIDDMGTNLSEARVLADIGVPLTFAIIPGLRNYREVAVFAASKNIETMIHIPMQSKGWPNRPLESNGLLVSMSADEIRSRLEGFLRDIPKAVGANNHMGSEFTEHADKMKNVLTVLQGKGLFFVDSVTSPQSAGLKVAMEMGLRSARRNVFLDNEQNHEYILGQLNQAVRLARKNGSAIAICHPHPLTIKTLAGVLPGLEKQGIKFVSASALVK